MTLDQIKKMALCQYGKHFLTKSYSIELLLFLLKNKRANGVEDLLISLKSSTPKFPAFLSYISLLEAKGCIKKLENDTKRSKKTIMLTQECDQAIRTYIQDH